MDANHVAAARARVFFFLTFKEFFHAFFFQQFEVFYHAHAITFAVPLVQVAEVFAGHSLAFAAGSYFMFR